MRLLIDTHALIWYVDQDRLLSPSAHAAITDPSNDLLLSGGSIWEIAIKVGLKKLADSDVSRVGAARWQTALRVRQAAQEPRLRDPVEDVPPLGAGREGGDTPLLELA